MQVFSVEHFSIRVYRGPKSANATTSATIAWAAIT